MQASIAPGTLIQNRYRILSVLGQGGFGRTYLAEDQSRFQELCAIKELIPPSAGDYALQKSKELFQREAQVLYQIRHPQVPQFHATFEQDGRFLIVQDYVQGKTYREQLEQLRSQGYVFSEPEVQQMIQQLLPTLSYLHGQGIIHRDISPENVILRERDRLPVLIDFGVVKELATKIQTPNQSQSIQATTVGKVGFAPSEQMQTGRAFPNSDLYALAVTAIVLLTGREPQELLDDRTMQWHWQRWATVSPGFAAVLNRMLSFAPGDRYASAVDVQQALQTMNQPGMPAVPQAAPQAAPAPVASAPPPTQATVAVAGTPQRAPARRPPDETDFARSAPMVPRRSSLWDDPFAILAVGLGLMFIAGIGTWAAFNALNRNRAGQPEPTPIAAATPTPTPDNSPQVFSQPLDLTPGKLATRSAKLKANETLNFTFSGTAGQSLKTSLSGEGVLLTLLGPDGQPLSSATKRVASWQGELPESGRYTISLGVVQGLPEGDFSLETTVTNPVKPSPTPTPTPTPSPTPTPTPDPTPPSPSPSPSSPQLETKQILIPQGETGVIERGQVAANQTQRYLVGARKGQILEVRVDNARLNIYNPDGTPVDNGAGVKGRSLQLSQDGDYIVDVSSAENVEFQLKVDVTN